MSGCDRTNSCTMYIAWEGRNTSEYLTIENIIQNEEHDTTVNAGRNILGCRASFEVSFRVNRQLHIRDQRPPGAPMLGALGFAAPASPAGGGGF